MGKRGPAGLNASDGGRTRSTGDSPPPPPGAPVCPDWLPDLARAAWDEVLPILAGMYELSRAYERIIAGYCLAWAQVQHASQTLEDEGQYVGSDRFLKAHPAQADLRASLKALREYGALLGLSPADNARLKIPKPDAAKPKVPVRDRTQGPPPPVEG
jgi:P27 family predicted phage terminase small subunit